MSELSDRMTKIFSRVIQASELEGTSSDWSFDNTTIGKLWVLAAEMNLRITELESKQRWIPVSERPPETYKPVLTVDMSEATQIPVPAFYNPDTKCWSTHFEYDLWVTHWMPLPELPEVQE